jgi:hypothetical protein
MGGTGLSEIGRGPAAFQPERLSVILPLQTGGEPAMIEKGGIDD